MTTNFDELQQFGREHLETTGLVAASLAKGLQTIAAETVNFSKKAIETNSAYVEELLGAKSPDDAIRIQSKYAKAAYEAIIAQATKIGELYTGLAKESLKPFEGALAKYQAGTKVSK